jgi:glycopeptide antibiotics resistance protein
VSLPIAAPTSVAGPAPKITAAAGVFGTQIADRQQQQWSRAADGTAERLGLATLSYVVATTLVITLAPFRFASRPVHGLFNEWTPFDLVMNVVMFLPFGFLYRVTRPRGAPRAWWTAIVLGALLSATIETAQLFETARYSSLFDVTTNTVGAAIGSLLFTLLARRLTVGATAVRTLALELPLMGLVYLLVPLLWLVGLSSAGSDRAWLLLPLAAFGGAVLGAIHGGYLKPAARTGFMGLLAASGTWFLVASFPGGRHVPEVVVSGTIVAMATAVLRSIATSRAQKTGAGRRFELPTLRLMLPVFAAYLALGSLWPLTDASATWHAGWALFPAVDGELSQERIFQALEYASSFSLVGYIIAEFYGRSDDAYGVVLGRVVRWSAALVLLLETARGWHADYGASVFMALLALSASVFGGWLYHLQRDHVRALWARDRGTSASRPVQNPTPIRG